MMGDDSVLYGYSGGRVCALPDVRCVGPTVGDFDLLVAYREAAEGGEGLGGILGVLRSNAQYSYGNQTRTQSANFLFDKDLSLNLFSPATPTPV
jgi:hypothetical protein